MAFSILALRTGEDTDGSIWPLMASEPGGMLTEPEDGDGRNVLHFPVNAVAVSAASPAGLKQQLSLRKITAWITITDSRVIFAASKWDKGSTFVGFGAGAVIALAATGVSKARAASRSKGKILAGQVRYPWLMLAGASAKTGWAGSDRIRLGFARKLQGADPQHYILDLTLAPAMGRGISPMDAASDILWRCAAWRLDRGPELTEEKRAKFAELRSAGPLDPPEQNKFTVRRAPDFYYVGAKTALPVGPEPAGS